MRRAQANDPHQGEPRDLGDGWRAEETQATTAPAVNVERIYIVFAGGIMFAAYRGVNALTLAGMHSRCVTGATVAPCELLDGLPPEIRDDISIEWEGENDTPVIEVGDISDVEPET